MGFLKKLGQILATGAKIVSGIGPIAFPNQPQLVTRVLDTLNQVAQEVMRIEAVGAALGLTGQQKLQGAIVAVSQLILQSDLLLNTITGKQRKVKDTARFNTGIAKLTEGVVDILSSLEDDINTTDIA